MFDPKAFQRALADPPDAQRQLIIHETVDSTSSDLLRRLARGAPGGSVVVSRSQTKGRGRQGRSWFSPPTGSLYLSLALDIQPLGTESVPLVPLAAGVALVRAVRCETGLNAQLKWPNDLLLGGRKLAGILCEWPRPGAAVLVVGLGLNVSLSAVPDELVAIATSLERAGASTASVEGLAGHFIRELEQLAANLGEPAATRDLVESWTALSEGFGRRVCVNGICGSTVGLDGGGRLLVRTQDGMVESVAGGIVEALD